MTTPLIMTTSGTRGIVGDNLSPDTALLIAKAFGNYLKKGTVIVGGDTRTSHEMYKSAVIAGLTSVGLDVIDIGKVPTPTVQQLIRHYQAQGGIVITASHNPIIWNGIKLMNGSGSFLNQAEFDEFIFYYNNPEKIKLAKWNELGKVTVEPNAIKIHIEKILAKLAISPIKNSGLKVLIDPNNGTGALCNPLLYEHLEIEYEMINAEPNGIFKHNPEPTRENLTQIMDVMKNGKYDIGFVQDADADRLVILNEKGEFIGEDYSFALCVDYLLSKIKNPNKKVVINLSTSLVIEHLAQKYQAEVTYTKIGEPNVAAKLKELKADVGGEGNGGVIYPEIGWGRDSMVGMITALLYLAESKKKVSEIIATYPKYLMHRSKIEVDSKEKVQELLNNAKTKFAEAKFTDLDGYKFMFDSSWLHIRPSNTEPIVRIFIEAKTQEEIDLLLQKIKD